MVEKNNDIKVPTGSHGFKGEWPKGQLTSGSLIQDLAEGAMRSDRSLTAQVQSAVQERLDLYRRSVLTEREFIGEESYLQGAVDALSFLRGQLDSDHPFSRWMFNMRVGRPMLGSDSEEG